jgi:hypothetical protein
MVIIVSSRWSGSHDVAVAKSSEIPHFGQQVLQRRCRRADVSLAYQG